MVSDKMREELSRPSAIRAMFEKGAELKKTRGADNVFDFSLGNPNLPPPPAVNETIIRLIKENTPGFHGYMPNAGHIAVRARIAEGLNAAAGVKHDPSGIIITAGAAAGLNVVFKSILDPGDEVIVIAPYFVEYIFYAGNHGGAVRVVNASPGTFMFDPPDIKSVLNEKTKAIILNSPNNPSGAIYPESLLKELSDILDAHEKKTGRAVYVISDEPYRELVYDGAACPVISDIFKNAVTCYSFSKSLSLAGERIGYAAVSPRADDYERLVNAMILANRTLGFVNANALFQAVIAECLDCNVDIAAYKHKRDTLFDIVTGAGFDCHKPQGAFYLFPKSPVADDTAFCERYCLKHGVLAAPGAAFGYPGYFRLAYCVSDETIERSKQAFVNIAADCAAV